MTPEIIALFLLAVAVKFKRFEHFNHTVASSTILVCGLSVAFLGM